MGLAHRTIRMRAKWRSLRDRQAPCSRSDCSAGTWTPSAGLGLRTYHPIRPLPFWHVFHPGQDNLSHTVPRRTVQLSKVTVEGKICFLDKRQPVVHHGPSDALSLGFSPHKPVRISRCSVFGARRLGKSFVAAMSQWQVGGRRGWMYCIRLGLTRRYHQTRWPKNGILGHLAISHRIEPKDQLNTTPCLKHFLISMLFSF